MFTSSESAGSVRPFSQLQTLTEHLLYTRAQLSVGQVTRNEEKAKRKPGGF